MRPSVVPDTTGERLPFSCEIRLDGYVVHVEADEHRTIQAIRGIIDDDVSESRKALEKTDPPINLHLRLSRRAADRGLDIPPPAETTSFAGNLELHFSGRNRMLVIDRKSVVIVDPAGGIADGYLAPEHIASSWVVAHRVFWLSLIELLRGRGVYYIHAGCVGSGEEGILICGPSGAGKSTAAYALARSGFSYLSDDGVFVRDAPGVPEVFSFPEKIKLDRRSCAFFEELNHFGKRKGKHEIALRDTGIRRRSRRARPACLIFPVRGCEARSVLRPLPRDEALVRLLRQSIPVLTLVDFQGQLQVLTDLVETCGCFELSAARDFDALPELISAVSGIRRQSDPRANGRNTPGHGGKRRGTLQEGSDGWP